MRRSALNRPKYAEIGSWARAHASLRLTIDTRITRTSALASHSSTHPPPMRENAGPLLRLMHWKHCRDAGLAMAACIDVRNASAHHAKYPRAPRRTAEIPCETRYVCAPARERVLVREFVVVQDEPPRSNPAHTRVHEAAHANQRMPPLPNPNGRTQRVLDRVNPEIIIGSVVDARSFERTTGSVR